MHFKFTSMRQENLQSDPIDLVVRYMQLSKFSDLNL